MNQVVPISLLCALSAMPNITQAQPQQQWVSGSFVNVRAAASKTANVVDKIIINTPVTVLAQSNGFCEINWGAQ